MRIQRWHIPCSCLFISILTVFLLSMAQPAFCQTIPSSRIFLSSWQNAGCPPNPIEYNGLANVRTFGAAGNGAVNDQPAVAAAIASLSGTPGIVYFPSGTYLIQSPITIPSGVILRGQSSQDTILRFDFVDHAIRIYGSETGSWIPLTAFASTHSNTILIEDGSVFSAGDYAIIRQDNDVSWNITDAWANYSAGQIVKITGIAGNTLTLERPLRHDYPLTRAPQIRRMNANKHSGVENLKLERLTAGDSTTRNNQYTIHFSYAAEGWVRGVHSHKAFGSHVAMDNSTKIDMTGSYLEDAHEYDDGGSGYGVKLQARSGECLIENNIFRRLRHSILLQSGANGNVFGYNYSRDTQSDSHPSWAGDIALHGNYPYANLFEGNIVEHLWIDNSHTGINGPFNTFFRNRAEKCGFNMTDTGADSQNVVGNELYRGSSAAQIAVGNGYHFMGSDHFTYGNNTQAAGLQPAGTANLPDTSYYLIGAPAQMPAWWNIPDALPIIGPEHSLSQTKNNPARARYYLEYNSNTIGGADGGGGGGCFIATAAFGSPAARHVQILRDFRDRYLLSFNAGKAFVKFYYAASPPVARFIAQNAALRLMTRWMLLPVIGVAYLMMTWGAMATFTLLIFLMLALSTLILILRRKMILPCRKVRINAIETL